MYIYLTSGTGEFMEQVKNKYPDEHMILLHGEGNSVLIHETEGKSVFATPRKFEVLDSVNELEERGFFVFNNIPVTDEGRPVFEHRFLNRARAIEDEPGFVAFRLLRPLNGDTYIVMTQWNGPHSFEAWKSSQAYKTAHAQREEPTGVRQQNIFSAASYVSTYSVAPQEEEEA
ncbi:antibiotic biosynthesis monooxygenase [Lysinibacillus sphaericus]|uniref:Antibiotic biosynthesis monooxygenase n=1 Tax=Lysinibacillus tabacifolii TaxID=1173107 RepID=A0ABY2STZ1_9BACI|nr:MULTISPECIES: antibiotic biosynthesis monooxygenase [Lysinibacillus]TKI44347.1 antibiotic biosynthesis monooxygenase [Lysinibacillus tabacifolii]UDK98313.1 antibiotic biosynthesis monooxygenase [Lysinibacillus sphaericus]